MPQKIWNAIIGAVDKIATWGVNVGAKAKEVISTMVSNVISIVKELPSKIWNAIVGAVTKVATWGTNMKAKAVEGIKNVVTGVINGFKDLPNKITDIGKNLVQGLWNGINNAKDWVLDKIKGFGDAILSGIKGFFGIHSPSRVMRDQVGIYLAKGIGVGFSEGMEDVNKMINDSVPSEFDVNPRVNMRPEDIDDWGDWDDDTDKPKGGAGGVVVNQYIYANETDYAAQQKQAAKNFKLIARAV